MVEGRARAGENVGRRLALVLRNRDLVFGRSNLLRNLRLQTLQRGDRGRLVRFRDLERGLRLGKLALIRNRIDAGEQLPARDGLAVLDQHLGDLSFDPRREFDHVGLDERVVGDGVADAIPHPPEQRAEEQQGQ